MGIFFFSVPDPVFAYLMPSDPIYIGNYILFILCVLFWCPLGAVFLFGWLPSFSFTPQQDGFGLQVEGGGKNLGRGRMCKAKLQQPPWDPLRQQDTQNTPSIPPPFTNIPWDTSAR